ncbi:hypothetical protein CLU79DRAFT_838878 [Phycomyces nitens]|nr:hypothetical protein CLU79DRAFT_838878 [Phycomyces nitens]
MATTLEGTYRDAYSSKYSGLDDGFKLPTFETVHSQVSATQAMNLISSTETPYPAPIKGNPNIDSTIPNSSSVVPTVTVKEYIHKTSTMTLIMPEKTMFLSPPTSQVSPKARQIKITRIPRTSILPSTKSPGVFHTTAPMSDITDLPSTIPDSQITVDTDPLMSGMDQISQSPTGLHPSLFAHSEPSPVDTSTSNPNLSPRNNLFPPSIVRPITQTNNDPVTFNDSIPLYSVADPKHSPNNFSLISGRPIVKLPLTEPAI